MQTENAYPQWHMSFLTPKISVRDKWSVISLTLLLTSNPLVHHTNLEILVFVTDIYEFCFIQLNLYNYTLLYETSICSKERNRQLIHRLKHTKTTTLTSRLSFGVLSLVMVPKMDG